MLRAWGKASNAPAPSMVFKITSEVTGPQTDAGKAKGPGPQGEEEWSNIQLPMWSYRLWGRIHQ